MISLLIQLQQNEGDIWHWVISHYPQYHTMKSLLTVYVLICKTQCMLVKVWEF